jgi:hypothetical protein
MRRGLGVKAEAEMEGRTAGRRGLIRTHGEEDSGALGEGFDVHAQLRVLHQPLVRQSGGLPRHQIPAAPPPTPFLTGGLADWYSHMAAM